MKNERELLKSPLLIAGIILAATGSFEAAFILAGAANVLSFKVRW